ncbi:hypothetical protein FHS92_001658 [Sphingobium subterraneum]|uniref:Uncharacterized protein n=1 Tax=Sphingobium subterraneum TaxID=627688 RepID=A0A841IYA7_9SPHN|nr:hypothetical protein [Sphingobium subterraneum]
MGLCLALTSEEAGQAQRSGAKGAAFGALRECAPDPERTRWNRV